MGFIAMRLLRQPAALFSLFYLLIAPGMVLAPALGDGGRALFRRWAGHLLGAVVSKLLFSFLLGVVLAVLGILASLHALGWWTQWLLMSAFWWGAYLRRHQALSVAQGALTDRHRPVRRREPRSVAKRVSETWRRAKPWPRRAGPKGDWARQPRRVTSRRASSRDVKGPPRAAPAHAGRVRPAGRPLPRSRVGRGGDCRDRAQLGRVEASAAGRADRGSPPRSATAGACRRIGGRSSMTLQAGPPAVDRHRGRVPPPAHGRSSEPGPATSRPATTGRATGGGSRGS